MLILFLYGKGVVYSQIGHEEICIDFRVNSTSVDTSFSDNASRMQEIINVLSDIRKDTTVSIVEVSFCGAASPEGSDQLNRKLASRRLASLENIIRREVDIPDSIITRNDSYIPWDYLKSQIEHSSLSHKEEVLAILDEESLLVDYHCSGLHIDNRIVKLKQIDNGNVWRQMNTLFFERMRNACAVFITYKEISSSEEQLDKPSDVSAMVIEPAVEIMEINYDSTKVAETVVPAVDEWTRKLHLKTNVLGLGVAIANLAIEIDIARHWSFSLPVFYSAWDYFKTTVKFRTLGAQPEFRYWFSKRNDGFFAGVHFGMAYYNFAFDGDYRYQDHNRETPAIGGGVSVGYRMPISKNRRWRMEFTVGAGVYDLHYDKFRNTVTVEDGLLVESIKESYWGIDQAALSFIYTFDLKKKGGTR